MRQVSLLLCLVLLSVVGQAQTLTLLDTVHTGFTTSGLGNTGGSDCWGWTSPDGTDYAFMGTLDGIAVVRASDQQLLDTLQGPQTMDLYFHRDIKTYGHYAYMTGEMLGRRKGMMIIDLQYLPDSLHFVRSWNTPVQIRSHNLSIDTANGYAYVLDSQYDGCYILDIHTDPENPDSVGFVETGDIHDVFARNDTAWIAEGNNGAFSIWDCSNKAAPVQIGRISSPGFGYCHNIWASEDGRYFATAEETPNKTIKLWDMQDPGNIQLRGEILAESKLVHNVHIKGNLIVTSHYESGITVINWSDPSNLVEVAHYDTYPASDTSLFHGCWGAFPFSKNGYMYASNIEGEFFLFGYNVGINDGQAPLAQLVEAHWPNPASERLRLRLSDLRGSDLHLRMIDVQGREVWRWSGASAPEVEVPVAALAVGSYRLRVQSGGSAQTVQVTVAR
jgi:choice-of-anchor B domain-containing protein